MSNETISSGYVEHGGTRYPVAEVIGVRTWQGIRQFRVICPYCGEVHLHGAGGVAEDIEDYRGHRNSHCYTNRHAARDVGYFIGEVPA